MNYGTTIMPTTVTTGDITPIAHNKEIDALPLPIRYAYYVNGQKGVTFSATETGKIDSYSKMAYQARAEGLTQDQAINSMTKAVGSPGIPDSKYTTLWFTQPPDFNDLMKSDTGESDSLLMAYIVLFVYGGKPPLITGLDVDNTGVKEKSGSPWILAAAAVAAAVLYFNNK